jgi:hypothetical protein
LAGLLNYQGYQGTIINPTAADVLDGNGTDLDMACLLAFEVFLVYQNRITPASRVIPARCEISISTGFDDKIQSNGLLGDKSSSD